MINFFLNLPPSSWRSELLLSSLIIGITGIGEEAHSQIRSSPMGTFLVFMFSFVLVHIFHSIFSAPDFSFLLHIIILDVFQL